MKYNITYSDALEICKVYKNFNFSEHMFRIDGFKLSTFDYFICGFNDFANPLKDRPEVNAFDMRGVTFVFDRDGTIWNKFLMLPKFFNLNQIDDTQYDKVKSKKIAHISYKEDGSHVAFMMLPNEKLFCKTIRGFDNDQATSSMNILYKWEEHVLWVKKQLKAGFTPLFEYVSYSNRIVLIYKGSGLRLIGLRDNNTGDFIPASMCEGVPQSMIRVSTIESTLDELIKRAKTEEDIEGWVIMFEDGQMIKIKTEWYWRVHGLRTENVFREDYIVQNYYHQTLDDIIVQLDKDLDADALTFIKRVTDAIDRYSASIDRKVEALHMKFLKDYGGNWSEFATKCHKETYFGFVSFFAQPEEYNKRKIDFILKQTYRLNSAKQIVEKYK